MNPQETDLDMTMSVQESPAETWVGSGLLQGQVTECSNVCMGPFEEGQHYLHYLHQFGLRSSYREGTQACPSTENWIKDLLNMAPPIRIRPSFPLSQSLPSGSFHKPLILIHQREDRMKTTITEN